MAEAISSAAIHLHFHGDLWHIRSYLWESQGGAKRWVQFIAAERPSGLTGCALNRGLCFTHCCSGEHPPCRSVPYLLKGSERRGNFPVGFRNYRINGEPKSLGADFYNYKSHSGRSIIIWQAPALNPPIAQAAGCAAFSLLLLLFSCCAVAFLSLCIMYIPHLRDLCLLISALYALEDVLMCCSLAGCWDSLGSILKLGASSAKYCICAISGPKLFCIIASVWIVRNSLCLWITLAHSWHLVFTPD